MSKSKPTVLHGPYGEGWAWCVTGSGYAGLDGRWTSEDDEPTAKKKAAAQLEKWMPHLRSKVVWDRVDVPLRAPKLGSGDNDGQGHLTDGVCSIDGVHLSFGGACPIQGEGTVDGFQAYYRARGHGWSLTISLSDDEEWTFGQTPYAFPDGGWLHRDESLANLETAISAFRTRFGNKGRDVI